MHPCKTSQSDPKRPKIRSKLTQNESKQAKITQNEILNDTQTEPKRPKTSQNSPRGQK